MFRGHCYPHPCKWSYGPLLVTGVFGPFFLKAGFEAATLDIAGSSYATPASQDVFGCFVGRLLREHKGKIIRRKIVNQQISIFISFFGFDRKHMFHSAPLLVQILLNISKSKIQTREVGLIGFQCGGVWSLEHCWKGLLKGKNRGQEELHSGNLT